MERMKVSFKPHELWVCPECKTIATGSLHIKDEGNKYNGDYCMSCYSRWIAENIPRLEEIKG